MDENEVIEAIKKHAEGQFPKVCSSCGVAFHSLAEYLEKTTRLGDPVSYDVEEGEWEPEEPLGTYFFVLCKCGTTLTIASRGMNDLTLRGLMLWFRLETSKRGVSMGVLLGDIRSEIRRRVLNESTGD